MQSEPALTPQAIKCGDAAGTCDSKSGEGISYALLSGIDAIKQIQKMS